MKRQPKRTAAPDALDASTVLRRAAANYAAALLVGGPMRAELQAIDVLQRAALAYSAVVRNRRKAQLRALRRSKRG